MTESIRVVYVPVTGVPVRAYHMALVYDKGDGTTPQVIQARPSIEYSGTEAQKNEVPREINELYNPFSSGPAAERNSPLGKIAVSESQYDNSYNNYLSKNVSTGDNLNSQWDAIKGTIDLVNNGNFAYLPLIQNSNTFAAFALQRAGIEVPNSKFFFTGGDPNATFELWTPASGKPLSIHQNPNASSLNDVTGTTVAELDGSITILALANDPNGGIIKTSANINSNDQPTEVNTSSSDGTSTKTVFDTGTEPWSSETSAYDAYLRLQSQRVVFDNGGQQAKQYDPNNTHPYNELVVTKGTDGKVTAAQVTLDPDVLAAGLSIGQIFGSALGGALGGNSLVGNLAGGAIGGLIGQRFVQALAISMTADLSKISVNDLFADQGVSVANAGIGAVSSFLTAELGHALHINGFDGQLFNTAVSGFTTSLLIQVTSKMSSESLTFAGAIAAMDWTQAVTGAIDAAQFNLGNLLGGYLGHEVVPAQTREGAIGGQLFGAIGGFILLGGLGSLIGTIIGTLMHAAALDVLQNLEVIGGDLLMKRAHQNSIGSHQRQNRRTSARRHFRGSGWRPAKRATASTTCIHKRFA